MLRPLALALTAVAALSVPALSQVTIPNFYNSARVLVPGNPYSPFSNWRAACSSPGWLRLIMADGSFYDVYATVGLGGEDGIGIRGVAAAGVPSPVASCVVTGLYYRRLGDVK